MIMKKIPSLLKEVHHSNYFYRNFSMLFAVLFIPFSVIIFFYYNSSVKTINNEIATYHEQLLDNSRGIADTLLTNMQNLGYYLATNTQVEIFSHYGLSGITGTEQTQLIDEIKALKLSNKSIDSIWVYSRSHSTFLTFSTTVSSASETSTHEWANYCMDTYGNKSTLLYSVKYNIYPHLISVYVPVTTTGQEVIGVVFINLNFNILNDIFNLSDEHTFYIANDRKLLYSNILERMAPQNSLLNNLSNEFISHSDFNTILQTTDDDYLYSKASGISHNLSYYLITDLDAYERYFSQLPILIIQFFIAAIMISLLLSYLLALRTTQPIRSLMNLFSETEDIILNKKEEDFLLEQIMNAMARNDNLQEQLTARVKLLEDSQMIALQTQINPHFLYNTLENIKWDAIELTGGDNSTSRSIQDLGKLLRYSLSGDSNFVPFSKEIEIVNLYLDIVNVGFEKKIKLEWEYEESVLSEVVPRLLLQPIIENSIQHGFRPLTKEAHIYIYAYTTKEVFMIILKDNGIGMTPEELELQRQRIQSVKIFSEQHIGLLNVAQRIAILYGSSSSIIIDSAPDMGTTITMAISKNPRSTSKYNLLQNLPTKPVEGKCR
ncbi:MAG: histidine kinase [Eubacteriales bacterium]